MGSGTAHTRCRDAPDGGPTCKVGRSAADRILSACCSWYHCARRYRSCQKGGIAGNREDGSGEADTDKKEKQRSFVVRGRGTRGIDKCWHECQRCADGFYGR